MTNNMTASYSFHKGQHQSARRVQGICKTYLFYTSRKASRLPPCRGVSHTIIEDLVDSPGSPFHSLHLAGHQKAGGYDKALRRQVNQLRRLKSDPSALALEAPPEWGALFADPRLPLVVDLGCGAGRCMLAGALAQEHLATVSGQGQPAETSALGQLRPAVPGAPVFLAREAAASASLVERGAAALSRDVDAGDMSRVGRHSAQPAWHGEGGSGSGRPRGANFLGVDVRLSLTSRANAWAEITGLRHRVAFLCANANASLPLLLGSYGDDRRRRRCDTATPMSSGVERGGRPEGADGPPGAAGWHAAEGGAARGDRGTSPAAAGNGSGFGRIQSVPPPWQLNDADRPCSSTGDLTLHGGSGSQVQDCRDAPHASSLCALAGPDVEAPCCSSSSGGAGSDSRCGGGAGHAGWVALVCLQFSDPPVRREALVGGEELVAQLAETLRPGALVWIQSDVIEIARTLRTLFWRHGGFAPSIRHAAATSAVVTRHWLTPQLPQRPAAARHQPSLPPPVQPPCPSPRDQQPGPQPRASTSLLLATSGYDGVPRSGGSGSPQAAVTCASGGIGASSCTALSKLVEEAARLPAALLHVDLAGHREPWLTEEQVAALVMARTGRDIACGDGTGVQAERGVIEREASCSQGPSRPGQVRQEGSGRGPGSGRSCGAGEVERQVASAFTGGTGGEGEGGVEQRAWEADHLGVVESVAADMAGWKGLPWLDANPLGVPTEREVYVERGDRPIYRLLLVRR